MGLDGVLADLDRVGHDLLSSGSAASWAFGWDHEDDRSKQWWPQGITSSADADSTSEGYAGRRRLVTSSYSKKLDGVTKGCRITVVDLTDEGRVRYRHVLLVDVGLTDSGEPEVRPVHDARRRDRVERHRADAPLVPLVGPGLRCSESAGRGVRQRPDNPADHHLRPRRRRHPGRRRTGRRRPRRPPLRRHQQRDARPGQPVGRTAGRPLAVRKLLPPGPEDLAYWPSRDELWTATSYPGRRQVLALERSCF